MPRHDAEYEVLLSEDVDASEESQSPPPTGGRLSSEKTWLPGLRTPSTSTSPLALWLGALVLVIAATDLAAVAYTARLARTVFAPKDFAARLEYASPYIGLDELYASGQVNSSVLEPITIRPRIAAQVFVREPDRPAPRGEHDYWHETYGRMSPNERRLRISPDVHTIIQFRAIDFGMEDCRLELTLPALGEQLEAGASLSMTPGSRIELFHLAAPRPIDVQALTYRTRPRAQGSVGSVVVDGKGGDVEFYKFPCKWSSLHAFEVRCVEGTECALDVWSSHNTTYGVNMVQHQTI
ncbi:hypothetical protein TRAPUB_11553 [Trametes pubescens]|uniref:Ubiquitin 3 binding protein But2 C-terminal domain-containing protein n=1 Tax=Trametes pubescens TaxID=154538 RepID=A0A1M2VWB5_TRAPU|nr:hypothetical protein TRAPUB_11553 [Trametes pubescens]